MTAEEIKRWDALGAVKTIKQAQGKGSKSVRNSSINISPVRQLTPPRSIRGGPHEMSSSSAATSKENSREKQHTPPRIMSTSPLQISRNPQSTSQVWPTNNSRTNEIVVMAYEPQQ
ncbi:hypothetical protein OUZ56_033863 [Daphnia magna]|uniref:Uncharacterized protein n=1 Tax=Daphnia magna TaxID=35525 RepID=A0ABQ9ZYX9_9CRUS|nr:hypothetical protein OUZ56_026616 [Daphnia magna]KAK4017890.1 hypothetical protein OUZ56_033863 [Daphnia magna]